MLITKEEMFTLYSQGLTYSSIAVRAGVSRQRIQQLICPPKNVTKALLKRAKNKCEDCGLLIEKPGDGHVHHKEKDGLLTGDVKTLLRKLLFLCRSCHRRLHCRISPSLASLKTHCKYEHSLETFYKSKRVGGKGYSRRCKICQRMANERSRQKRRARNSGCKPT